MMKKPLMINIEGIDGSGKTVISEMLISELMKDGYSVHTTNFPDYDSASGKFIRSYLNGEIYPDPTMIHPYAASLPYVVDRQAWYAANPKVFKDCDIIIGNRSHMSNLFYQASRLNSKDLIDFIKMMHKLEIEIPRLAENTREIHTVFLHHPNLDVNMRFLGHRPEMDLYETREFLQPISEFAVDFREMRLYSDLIRNYPAYQYLIMPCSDETGTSIYSIECIADSIRAAFDLPSKKYKGGQ